MKIKSKEIMERLEHHKKIHRTKTSLYLADELYDSLKGFCKKRDLSIGVVVEELIRSFLKDALKK